MSSGWFNSLGWWKQEEAYAAFDLYRTDPTDFNYDDAVNKALPIIRVVYSTQKFKVNYAGDEDDLISHAALTITKALPKMITKPVHKLDNDKKYMRYLFTCVINAFYREYDILHGKHNKLQRKLNEHSEQPAPEGAVKNFRKLEAEMTLKHLPQQLYDIAIDMVRFEEDEKKICVYILNQIIEGREVAKSVLQLIGCKDRNFFIGYCQSLLFQAFIQLRKSRAEETADYLGGYTEVDEGFNAQDSWRVDYYDY
jgi:hypothetical protein